MLVHGWRGKCDEYMPVLMIVSFASALVFTLLLVPYFSRLAVAHGYVDKPNARKVHSGPMPRIGGVAIFIAFYVTLVLVAVLFPKQLNSFIILDHQNLLLILGSLVAFGVGLADDFKGLRARRKLGFQIVAAGLAYAGGIRVETIGFYSLFQLELGWLSPFVTMFWIVLVINAYNLIDGLDGLAGGVGIIACGFLAYVCVMRNQLVGLVFMTVISGGLLGFLRYNFYPASVFMGDGGSYFLGYLLGTTSAYCAMNNSATLSTLIPMLVVALPIIDVTMATLRRFIHGRGIFTPDKLHFHHMLLRMGLSHRNAVIVLYAVTLLLSCCALLFLRVKDEKAYVLFLALGMFVLFCIASLGYFRNYDIRAIIPWLNGIGDEVGLSRERRSFFDMQLKIGGSQDLPELWRHMGTAAEMLGFMTCAIYLQKAQRRKRFQYAAPVKGGGDRRQVPALHATVAMRQSPPDWLWCSPTEELDQHNRSLFRVEMDLQNDEGVTFGTLLLVKNQAVSPVSHYTLKRVEHLKRSVVKALERMSRQGARVVAPEKVQAPVVVPRFQYVKAQEQVEKLK